MAQRQTPAKSIRRIRMNLGRALVVLAISVGVLGVSVQADAADEKIAIRSAYLVPTQGVYLLDAKLHLVLPEGARRAVQDGVALTLHAEIELQRARRWWLDETIATLEQNYEVVYHALSENYLLRNLNSGEQTAYSTFDSALEALSLLHDLPVLDQSLLNPREEYEVRLRVTLDVRTLPETLRVVLFWKDNWRQRTEWYLWPLKP